jgi:uncharacterized protein YdaU (DUF1376 family)
VNFYKRHLGDYAKDAGHLSMLEHGAYTLLLDRYYTTEEPIPSLTDAYRICRARSRDEREAVDTVLREFFVSDGEAFMNRRAEEEIAKASHQRTVNQELGKRGGRPKKTESVLESETEHITDSVPISNPSQTPDSRHQEPEEHPPASRVPPSASPRATPAKPIKGKRLPDDWHLPKPWGEWALAEYPQWTPEKVRTEAAKFADHWHAATGKTAVKADWLATWRNWCRSDIAHREDHKPGRNGTVVTVDSPETIERYQARMAAERAASMQGVTAPPPEVLALAGKLRVQ